MKDLGPLLCNFLTMQPSSNNNAPSESTSTLSRRRFLRGGVGSAIGFTFLPSYLALGKEDSEGNIPPSKRINYAAIGTNGRGSVNAQTSANNGAMLVASCDVVYMGLEGKDENNKPRYSDFRTLLDKHEKDIDAVIISTPDHTHYCATIDAMRRGKHVYVEKPLTHTFAESELLLRAAEKYGVVNQMGNQGHTSAGATQFQQLVKAGVISDIVRIDAYMEQSDDPSAGLYKLYSYINKKNRFSQTPPAQEIPANLNWDEWCGPLEPIPYNEAYHPAKWRGFFSVGAGLLGDWGAHIIDFAHDWLQLGFPTRIEVIEQLNHTTIQFPSASHICLKFPARGDGLPACDLHWTDGINAKPTVPEQYWDKAKDASSEPAMPKLGGAGTLLHRQQGDYLIERGSHTSASRLLPRAKMSDFRDSLKAAAPPHPHMGNFIQACLGNTTCSSPFSKGAPLTQVMLLGTIAQRLNRSLDFDATTKRFINDDEANALLDGAPVRDGWKDYYTV